MPPPAVRVLVIADDLSGAADCAISWIASGCTVTVLLDPAAAVAPAMVLAIDTDSRRLPPAAAAAAVRQALHRHAGGRNLVYKKIDSTLRGPVGTEVAAAAEGRFVLFAPAFPATGRTLEAGTLRVAGVPLAETELWRREGGGTNPDPHALLAAAGLSLATAPLALVRGGALAAWLAAQAAAGAPGALLEATTEADLATIAAAGRSLALPLLWVGSGGLARHLCPPAAATTAPLPPRRPGRPLLAAIGSLAAISRRQLARLALRPGSRCLAVAPEWLATAPTAALTALAARLDALLADPATELVAVSIAAEADADPGCAGAALARGFARLLAPRLQAAGGLLATGGETARTLLTTAGVPALALHGEVETAVPLGVVLGDGPLRGLPVITKAGAFGDEATLVRAAAAWSALPTAPA
jgi:uncharacterized protein YgbK (DUF1537 family)